LAKIAPARGIAVIGGLHETITLNFAPRRHVLPLTGGCRLETIRPTQGALACAIMAER
jgi:hypothetical protein